MLCYWNISTNQERAMHQTPKRAVVGEIRDGFSMFCSVFQMLNNTWTNGFCALILPPVFTILCSWLGVQMNILPPPYYTHRIVLYSPYSTILMPSWPRCFIQPLYFADECARLRGTTCLHFLRTTLVYLSSQHLVWLVFPFSLRCVLFWTINYTTPLLKEAR